VLITCGGAFNAATHQYADNVLATAVPARTRATKIATRTHVAGQQAASVAQDFSPLGLRHALGTLRSKRRNDREEGALSRGAPRVVRGCSPGPRHPVQHGGRTAQATACTLSAISTTKTTTTTTSATTTTTTLSSNANCGAAAPATLPTSPVVNNGLPTNYVIPADATAAETVAITYALAQLGKPYLWGGAGPRPLTARVSP